MNRYITLNIDNKITGIRFGTSIVEGEVASDEGELGQILQEGAYIDDPTPPPVAVDPMAEVRSDNLDVKEIALDLLLRVKMLEGV